MNVLNNKGVCLFDVYVMDYYGIIVFFQVCKTTRESVFIMELATKRYKDGLTLTKTIKGSKTPLVVVNNNTYEKTKYEVIPTDDKRLPIKIEFESKIWKEARKYVDWPRVGVCYAFPYNNYKNKYWKKPDKKIKENVKLC